MGITERSGGKHEGAYRVRQLAGGDPGRGFRRIEGEDDVEFAVGQFLLHVRIILRKGLALALAPEQRVQLVEIGKERCHTCVKVASSTGFCSFALSAISSLSTCFRKDEPMKSGGCG